MSSKYTLIQYYPDPLAEERVNIGVVTWDEAGANAKFIESWERARSFGGRDTRFLRDFARSLQKRLDGQPNLFEGDARAKLIEQMIAEWGQSIQLTPARGSLENARTLLTKLSPRFLQPAPVRAKHIRDRRTATSQAYRAIKEAVIHRRPNDVDHLVHLRRVLKGQLSDHRFDVVLANGHAMAAVNALSFELRSPEALQKEVDSTAWALDDVRKVDKDLPLAIYVLPPTNADAEKILRSASKVFKGLGAKLVDEEVAMARWATQQADRLVTELIPA